MKRVYIFTIIVISLFSLPSVACSKGKVSIGKAGIKTVVGQQDFSSSDCVYVIKGVCDLSGKTVSIPEKAILDLRGGELRGGTIVLAKGVSLKNGHTKNLNVSTKGFFSNEIIYIDNPKYAPSHFLSVSNNMVLCCDIDLASRSSGLSLNANLDGNGHSLRIAGSSNDLLYLNKNNITIKNIKLENRTTNPKADCRVILSRVGGVTIKNCTLEGAMVFAPSSGVKSILKDILITNNIIDCDFSILSQGYNYQHDVLTFRACKNIVVSNNTIRAKDVNRVFKTARGWTVDKDAPAEEKARPCVENILIEGNDIISHASCGKQFWDMYNGTINPSFINNVVHCFGHTVMFENKTKDDNGAKSVALIEGNTIESDWKLFFLNSNMQNDSYIIRNNDVIISGTEREHVDLVGQKKNRNYVNSMAGFASVVFEGNTVSGIKAGEGLYPFIFQLESGEIAVRNNTFNKLGPTLIVESATVKSLLFDNNQYKIVNGFDCELEVGGDVSSIVYKNADGVSKTAVRMSKKAYDSCQEIDIVAPKSNTQLKVKQGDSFNSVHGRIQKRRGIIEK